MAKINKRRIVIAALVGGAIFCLIIFVFDSIIGRAFSWKRYGFYYIFAALMYGFLTYRNFKKHQK